MEPDREIIAYAIERAERIFDDYRRWGGRENATYLDIADAVIAEAKKDLRSASAEHDRVLRADIRDTLTARYGDSMTDRVHHQRRQIGQ